MDLKTHTIEAQKCDSRSMSDNFVCASKSTSHSKTMIYLETSVKALSCCEALEMLPKTSQMRYSMPVLPDDVQ